MALREGEACGCEVTVTRSAAEGCPSQQNPTCCSAHTREKMSS